MIRLLNLALAAVLAGTVTHAAALPTVVYSNGFEGGAPSLAGWSLVSSNGIYDSALGLRSLGTDTTPVGARGFLGQFGGDDAVSLALTGVAAAPAIRVEFDVYFIRSWDGSGTGTALGYLGPDTSGTPVPVPVGPDVFGVKANGATLFENTFSLGDPATQPQTYCPGTASPCAPTTGASERYTLGYQIPPFIAPSDPPFLADMVVHYSATLGYTSDLTLTFYSSGLQLRPAYGNLWQGQGDLILDESWGIDNVTVTAVPEPGTYVLLALGLGILAIVARRSRARPR